MLDPQHFYGSGLTASLRLARCCERLRDGSFLVLELLVPKINKNITINFKFRWGHQASSAQRDGGNLPHSGEAVLGPLHLAAARPTGRALGGHGGDKPGPMFAWGTCCPSTGSSG